MSFFGIESFSFVKTYLKWSLGAFALSWSVISYLLFTSSVEMGECSGFFSDEGPALFWICHQTFSNDVVNVTFIRFGHFFGGIFYKETNLIFFGGFLGFSVLSLFLSFSFL